MDTEFEPFEEITVVDRAVGLTCLVFAAPGMVVFIGCTLLWIMLVVASMIPLVFCMVFMLPGLVPLSLVANYRAMQNGTERQYEQDRLMFAATGVDPRKSREEDDDG